MSGVIGDAEEIAGALAVLGALPVLLYMTANIGEMSITEAVNLSVDTITSLAVPNLPLIFAIAVLLFGVQAFK